MCDCEIDDSESTETVDRAKIIFCSLHASASELLLACKDALLMLTDLTKAFNVRPEMFRSAEPVDRLFKVISKAEGK